MAKSSSNFAVRGRARRGGYAGQSRGCRRRTSRPSACAQRPIDAPDGALPRMAPAAVVKRLRIARPFLHDNGASCAAQRRRRVRRQDRPSRRYGCADTCGAFSASDGSHSRVGVGKTSLSVRYVQESFSTSTPPTIGASFLTKRMCAGTVLSARADSSPAPSTASSSSCSYGIQQVRSATEAWYDLSGAGPSRTSRNV